MEQFQNFSFADSKTSLHQLLTDIFCTKSLDVSITNFLNCGAEFLFMFFIYSDLWSAESSVIQIGFSNAQ